MQTSSTFPAGHRNLASEQASPGPSGRRPIEVRSCPPQFAGRPQAGEKAKARRKPSLSTDIVTKECPGLQECSAEACPPPMAARVRKKPTRCRRTSSDGELAGLVAKTAAIWGPIVVLPRARREVVEARGFEPLTPAMRTQCSPAELRPPNGTKDYIGSGEAREQTDRPTRPPANPASGP